MTTTYDSLLKDLKARNFSPIYYLMGEEAYFIDSISDYIEKNVLSETEQDFNQTVVFGADTNMQNIIDMAKRYPMMSEYQVVIVKEAQTLKDTDALEQYLSHIMPTTILVFCHKNGTLDKRKKLGAMLTKHKDAVVFVSNKLKEDKLPQFVTSYLKADGISINEQAVQIIVTSIGSDLSRLVSEIDKLKIGLNDTNKRITPETVEEVIGINKDFNNFELVNAVTHKQIFKANQIISYFEKNDKAGSLFSVIPYLFMFYSNLMQIHYAPRKDERGIAEWLGIAPWMAKNYIVPLRLFSPGKTLQIISKLREFDMRGKGVNNNTTSKEELLKELLFFILH